jgi:hypothetical protein
VAHHGFSRSTVSTVSTAADHAFCSDQIGRAAGSVRDFFLLLL